MTSAAGKRRNAKLALGAVVVLFVSGFLIAYVLTHSGWRPSTTKNYGELVEPVRPVRDVVLSDANGQVVPAGTFRGKWTLVYFGSAECLKPCTENLYKLRQLVAAQGREAHRVQSVFVVTNPAARDMLRYALADYPDIRTLFGSPEALRTLAEQFSLSAGSPLDGLHRIYVVDPLGNFMMSYAADADLSRMNKDLKLLLRASHIG